MRNYITEFIGTFFLVFTIGLAVPNGTAAAPVAIGCSLMVMVYMGGHVSGGHYNPAVSLAVLLKGRMTPGEFAAYVVSQCAGAILASLVVYAVLGKTFAPAPAATATVTSALIVELLYTFALALVVLNVAVAGKTTGNSFYGLAIGFTIVVAAYAGGPISGGAFNPAVGFGPIVVSAILSHESLGNLWIYWVGPLAGGALAAGVFGVQEGEAIPVHANPDRQARNAA